MYISVNGVGTSIVVPDAVKLFASVSVIADSNKDALANASNSANAVRAALNKQAIASKDITTSSLLVSPEYSYSQEKGQRLLGYRATQSFTIVLEAEIAGAVIDAVVDAGGNSLQINGVSPFLSNGATATDTARKAAVSDAKSKANSYAKYLGTSIDKVIDLFEVSAPTYTFPIVAVASKVELSDAATQIDLGSTEVTVNVKTRWRLKDIKPKSK